MTAGRRRVPFAPGCAHAVVVAVVASTLFVAVGCSSSSPQHTSSPGGSGSASGTPADAQTTREISAAYSALFASSSTEQAAVAALQHGSAFAKTINSESKTSYAQKSSAKVTMVRLLSDNLAAVTFTISTSGLAISFPGHAVRTNGKWQVAAETFCSLLTKEGTAPKVCRDPSITALPH